MDVNRRKQYSEGMLSPPQRFPGFFKGGWRAMNILEDWGREWRARGDPMISRASCFLSLFLSLSLSFEASEGERGRDVCDDKQTVCGKLQTICDRSQTILKPEIESARN